MSKITLLGTCSGTEPMPNMHHCSMILETNNSLYWFDCGEGAVYNAFNSGVDFMNTRAVFISHMHFDHIGSLSHLIFTVHKMCSKHKRTLNNGNSIDFYLPDTYIFDSIKEIAVSSRNRLNPFKFGLNEKAVKDGLVYEDENIRVTANHNTHLKENGENGWHSYSYLIEIGEKRIVFSGDVGKPQELDTLIGNGCDVLIMETGHHKVCDILAYAESHSIGTLYFNHHGREILEDRKSAQALADASKQNTVIATDGTTIEL